jgi:hypothetical protein
VTAKGNAVLVDALGSSLRYGGNALEAVPELLKKILTEDAWREFITQRGEHVEHERFADFVTTPPLKGIGATAELLYRIAPDLTDQLDKAFGRKTRTDKISVNDDNINDSDDLRRPSGTAQRAALRKLRKDAPELHSEVIEGRLSAHAAMVKAGFRPKTQTIRVSDPQSAARTLRKHMSPEARQALARLLMEEDNT